MHTYIYLDQNTLSDLRERKRKGRNELCLLYDFIHNSKLDLLYSFTHLDEIRQIPKQEYIEEHIETLCDLKCGLHKANGGWVGL